MKIKLQDFRNYLILIISFGICLGIIYFADNILWHITAFATFCIIQIVVVKFDLMHPYCWFSAFFLIYSSGFPIITYLDIISRAGYSKEVMIYQLIALFVFLFIVGPRKLDGYPVSCEYHSLMGLGIFYKIIYALTVLAVFSAGIYVYISGYSGKGQIYSDGSWFLNFLFKLPLVLSLMVTVSFISDYKGGGKALKNLFFPGIALLIITIFSGERDFVFRFILMIMIAMWTLRIIKLKSLFVLAPLLALLIPLSAIFKYYFTQGTVAEMAISSNSILFALFSGEFESASTNLQIILNDSMNTNGKVGFIQIIYDIGSAFYSEIPSTSSWFNQTYYPNSLDVQYGFSLVGEGYLIGGLLGIIVLFSIVGLMTRWFYYHSYCGIYMMGGYIYYITVVIYSIRGDFSIITSALTKQIGLVLLILYLLEYISMNKCYKIAKK